MAHGGKQKQYCPCVSDITGFTPYVENTGKHTDAPCPLSQAKLSKWYSESHLCVVESTQGDGEVRTMGLTTHMHTP